MASLIAQPECVLYMQRVRADQDSRLVFGRRAFLPRLDRRKGERRGERSRQAPRQAVTCMAREIPFHGRLRVPTACLLPLTLR